MIRIKCFSTGGEAIYVNQVDEIIVGSINGVFFCSRILIALPTNATDSLVDYTRLYIYSLHKHTTIDPYYIII